MADNARNTREIILSRIRAANGDTAATVFAPSPERDWQALPRAYQRKGELGSAERVQLFAERMEDYNASVSHSDEAGLRQAISDALNKRGKEIIVVPNGFPEEFLPLGVRVIHEAGFDTAASAERENVITLCTVAIAATGTVVLQHGAGEGERRLSLLPDYHLCIVRESQIEETVPEAMDVFANSATRPTTFISGPSATSDIEMTRIKGVHGPRFLDVIIVR
jgi:L-lactate dehydrogenase complex protein LldG